MSIRGVWLCALIMFGCDCNAHRSEPRTPSKDTDSRWDVTEATDKCSYFFSQDCFADEDGCPDPPKPVVSFAAGSSTLRATALVLLKRIAKEIPRLKKGTTLQIVGFATKGEPAKLAKTRAEVVQAWLHKQGVKHRMTTATRPGRPGVELRVTGCWGDTG